MYLYTAIIVYEHSFQNVEFPYVNRQKKHICVKNLKNFFRYRLFKRILRY